MSWFLAIAAAEYVLKVVPKGTHDWNKFVTPDELKSYLTKSSFFNEHFLKIVFKEIILFKRLSDESMLRQIYGMAFNPFANSWKWTGITSINYALHATKHQQESTCEKSALPIPSPKSAS